jgi:hypothetical protein
MPRFRDLRDGAPAPRGIAGDGPLVYLTFGSVAALLGLYPRVYRKVRRPVDPARSGCWVSRIAILARMEILDGSPRALLAGFERGAGRRAG